jgi:two-component system sensor kinase FixL
MRKANSTRKATSPTARSRAGLPGACEHARLASDTLAAAHGGDTEARFQALLEAAPDAMMLSDAGGRIHVVNAQAEVLLGYRREELIGRELEMLMPERFRTRHVHHRRSYTPNSPPRPMGTGLTLLALHKDGREIPVEISLSNLDDAGCPMVISSIRDVSARVAAEEALRRLNEELELRVGERTLELQRAHEVIQAGLAERLRLEKEILEISERERQRIGQDLHDDLGQQLAGAWCLSQALENDLRPRAPEAAASAARITQTLQKSLALTRSLARGLHPVAIEAGGLGAALKDLAAQTSELFHVRCTCRLPQPMPAVEQAAATQVYRIAQESVTNAVKHGKATTIALELKASGDEATLTIRDNGCGLPASGPGTQGMGLRIMPYRAGMIGGRLEFARGSRGGTVVTCVFPAAHGSPISTP